MAEYISENWTIGLTGDNVESRTTVRIDVGNNEAIFHQATWIQRFKEYCMKSDLGLHQRDIIERVFEELKAMGVIVETNKSRSLGGKPTRCFIIDLEKANKTFNIEPEMWEFDKLTDV